MADIGKAADKGAGVSKKQKNRKDKPWDHEGIDHWKVEEFKSEEGSGAFLAESSFATLFPQYREKYLLQVWSAVTSALKRHGIGCELNAVEGSMTVRTTRQTRDPFMILKGRDLIKLLARSVPVSQAVKILEDEMQCDIVKIGGFVENKEKFVKRRERLIGPKGSTLKAIELLTDCYILVQGNTVACMGGFRGLKQTRRIIEECMRNIHPVYNIKTLMIKRELEKDAELKNEVWERFLPKFKKTNMKKKKKNQSGLDKKKKKEYTPFPPLPQASKVDLQLESGEYFMNEEARRRRKVGQEKAEREEKSKSKREQRELSNVAPDETKLAASKRKRDEAGQEAGGDGEDVVDLAARVKKKAKKVRKSKKQRSAPL